MGQHMHSSYCRVVHRLQLMLEAEHRLVCLLTGLEATHHVCVCSILLFIVMIHVSCRQCCCLGDRSSVWAVKRVQFVATGSIMEQSEEENQGAAG